MDCDARVLSRYPDKQAYGTLLLEVGSQRAVPRSFALVALAEPKSTLERRIESMTDRIQGHRGRTALGLAGLATMILVFACEAPVPTVELETDPAITAPVVGTRPSVDTNANPVDSPLDETTVGGDGDAPAPPPSLGPDDIRSIIQSSAPPPSVQDPGGPVTSAAPGFTPYEFQPELRNRAEVGDALEREYPPLLRDAGVGGTVMLWLYIDETGSVENVLVNTTSQHAPLDAAALRVAWTFQFTPALQLGAPTAVWVAMPITFEP